MALTWGGTGNVQHAWNYIYAVTGVWPSVTSVNGSRQAVTSTAYAVKWSGSSGPYIIVGLRNDPNAGISQLDFRVTVDGSVLLERTGVPYIGYNDVIGQWFDSQSLDHGCILCRSSYSIEVKKTAFAPSTEYAVASIYQYSIT